MKSLITSACFVLTLLAVNIGFPPKASAEDVSKLPNYGGHQTGCDKCDNECGTKYGKTLKDPEVKACVEKCKCP